METKYWIFPILLCFKVVKFYKYGWALYKQKIQSTFSSQASRYCLKTFMSYKVVVLLRVLVFKFFCKLFNFFVADGRKPARHASILNNKRDAINQFNKSKRRELSRHWTIRQSQRWQTENTPLGSRMKWRMESTSGLLPSKTPSSI